MNNTNSVSNVLIKLTEKFPGHDFKVTDDYRLSIEAFDIWL